ncbi:Mitochondrial chaperone BCS1 [Mycena indigotica]|uniref:Mitochondrial chaperone BCS1 n=1 Tax=Mycena indigotica TaxID=2126181 RepID=A0A8H6T2V4_9AGAR|nr:Mitochondrial chaperone BCS1 [Mycena indigotica]KAF7309874.1 Mitochondrial chaperone BCS1 [Mycena indigotica]
MATYFTIAQQVFSALNGPANAASSNATEFANGLSNSTTTSSPPSITDLSSLATFLLSFGALADWLKLIVFGGALETLRRMAFSLYYKIIASFWITASFHEEDSSYDWMMVWLSKQSSWETAREVEVSTRSFGLNSSAIIVPGEEDDLSLLSSRKLAYLPSASLSYSMWYHRRYMTVTRVQTQTGYYGQKEERLQINIFTRTHRVLNELLLEAKKEYMAASEHSISIFVSDSNNSWRNVASRPKRNLSSIILDPGVAELLVDDARDFLESKPWYAARGIPFRRGYLLYGAPGSGKTSIISSIAGELALDVYIVSLSRVGLDDSALSELISNLPEKCICLMEDIDCAFSQNLNRDEPSTPADAPGGSEGAPPPPPTAMAAGASTSRISLSGLLNALDGVAAQEGRILYATTNKYTSLDPALCRPGRMDIHVEFKLASRYQAKRLFNQFYLPFDEDAAKKKEAEKATGKAAEDDDSGYNSADEDAVIDLDPTPSEKSDAKPTYFGTSHREHAPQLRPKQIAALAERFAEAIPEREMSMASLQGYLMTYKIRPYEAVRSVKEWVADEREARAKREKAQAAKIKSEAEAAVKTGSENSETVSTDS